MKATVYGLNTRPSNGNIGVEIPAGETREFTFAAGAPGTCYYRFFVPFLIIFIAALVLVVWFMDRDGK